MKSRRAFILTSVALLALGCGQTPNAPFVAQPTPDPSPDAGHNFFACGEWSPREPSITEATFDFVLDDSSSTTLISMAGGTILHLYQVPMVRARIRVSAVPSLFSEYHVRFAQQVQEDEPLEFIGYIGIPTPLSDVDRSFLESLGVAILYVNRTPVIAARIPDVAVPAIRSHSGVTWVAAFSHPCIGVDGVSASP